MVVRDTDRDTDLDWNTIAESDPFWGVLSVEDYRGQDLKNEQQERFYNTGQLLVENIMRDIRLHLDKDFAPNRSLDFGCGVGRLLIPIARHTSGEAIGIDIAPNMLALAQRYADQSNAGNVVLLLADDELSSLTGDFDFINSYIVLQHIPPSRGYSIASKLISMLRPKGVGSLQFTFAKDRKFFMHEAPTARFYRREDDTIRDILPRDANYPPGTVRMFDYDLNNFFALIASCGIEKVVSNLTNDDGHLGVHLIFKRNG
jgi:SAM-dependent methyltransferase